jgi:hypothetical protein
VNDKFNTLNTQENKMKAEEFISEYKKGRKAVRHNPKPRNPVAHASQSVIGGSASGAHKDKTKEIPRHEKHKTVAVVGEAGGYDQGRADPHAPSLGAQDRREFKRAELQHELGDERNNIAVSINGKLWKVFAGKGYADSIEERQHLNHMRSWAEKKSAATGKKWSVSLTGAEPTT